MGFHSQPRIAHLTVEADTRKVTLPLHSMLILGFLGGLSLQKQLATLSFIEDANFLMRIFFKLLKIRASLSRHQIINFQSW